mmetsp:Transcript_3272/g.3886  ORF Transcript_3272/g.3886 Transcript_3272/m.3886 type:complete len:687 (+) Transcript_3272:309-2369(+)
MNNLMKKLKRQGSTPTPVEPQRIFQPRPPPPRKPQPSPASPTVKRQPSLGRAGPAPVPGRGTLLRVKKKRELVAKPPAEGKSSVKLVPRTLKASGKDAMNPFSQFSMLTRNHGLGREGLVAFHCIRCRSTLMGVGTLDEPTLFRCTNCASITTSLCAARVSPVDPTDVRWTPTVQDDKCLHWICMLTKEDEERVKATMDELEGKEVEEIESILQEEYNSDPSNLPSTFPDSRKEELIQYVVAYKEFTHPFRSKDGFLRETMGNGDIHWSRVGQCRSELIGVPEAHLEIVPEEFANLAQAPFEEKVEWFQNQLNKLRWEDEYEGPLRIMVHRDYLLEESSNWVNALHGLDRWRSARYEFVGEPAMDSGGVAKEWYRLVCDSVFKPEYGLFEQSDLEDVTYDFNPSSELFQPERHLHYFRFGGRILAKAIFEGCFVDAHLTKVIYKHIIGRPCGIEDLKNYDRSLYQSLMNIIENADSVGELELAFSVGTNIMGTHTEVELKEGGSDLFVTKDNLAEYVKLFLKYYLYDRSQAQLTTFLKGFHEIIPQSFLSIFTEDEFERIMCGVSDISVADWKQNVTYRREFKEEGENHPVIVWFWEAVTELSTEDREKLLQFITGSSRVPVGGFAGFESGKSMLISIESITKEMSVFPRAHTCFNRMELPLYDTKEELVERLKFALEFTNGFNLE